MDTSSLNAALRRYWLAAAAAFLVLGIAVLPGSFQEALLLRRDGLSQGELWRLWSGHCVHWGWNHLFWDLCSFLVITLWLLRLGVRHLPLFLLISAPLMSLALLALCPRLAAYGGLSGLVCSLVSILGLVLWRKQARAFASLVLALLLVKIASDWFCDQGTFSYFSGTVRNVPWAHVLGAAMGFAFGSLRIAQW